MIHPRYFALSLALAFVHPEAMGQFEIHTIVPPNSPAPDGNGLYGGPVLSPVLNEEGRVALAAQMKGTFAGNQDADVLLIADGSGSYQIVAREGAIAPDGVSTFNALFAPVTFQQPSYGDTGSALAIAHLFHPSAGFSTALLRGGATAPQILAREGYPLFSTGRVTEQILSGYLGGNSSSECALLLDTSAGSVITRGMWKISPAGAEALLQSGDPSPDGTAAIVHFQHEAWTSINERGDALFSTTITTPATQQDRGLFVAWIDGTLHVIAREGDTAPGGGSYPDFGGLNGGQRGVINEVGEVFFNALGRVFRWTPGGPVELVLKTNDPSPDGQGQLLGMLDPVAGHRGNFAVQVALPATTSTGTDVGIVAGTPGALEMIARTGDPFPGGGLILGNSFSMPYVNDSGTVAFSAGSSNNVYAHALFMKRSGEPLREIVRSGEVLDGHFVDFVAFPPVQDPGNNKPLNESDEALFIAYFIDGSSGIYLARPCATPSASPCTSLDSSPKVNSVATGGTVTFELAPGPTFAGDFYFLLGTVSGTTPGVAIGQGSTLPLNPDPWFQLVGQHPNTPLLPNSFGLLDPTGRAQVKLVLPPAPSLQVTGLLFHHAYVVFAFSNAAIVHTSNATPLTLLP